MKPTLPEFLADNSCHNAWIISNIPDIEIYVRKSFRNINNHRRYSFDIANISVTSTGEGKFTEFFYEIKKYITYPPFNIIYIENILQHRFLNFFITRGFLISDVSTFDQKLRFPVSVYYALKPGEFLP